MKPLIFLLVLILISSGSVSALTYTPQYPINDSDHVNATSDMGGSFMPYYATDPARPLIGTWSYNVWLTASVINQRFHIDLNSSLIIRRIYLENVHHSGGETDSGVRNFTFWGSDSASDFNDEVYANDGTWTQLTVNITSWVAHIAANQADPQYALVDNSVAYRYYAFKFANNWGSASYFGLRHTELQTEDDWPPDTCTPPATGNYDITASDACQWTENDEIPGNVTITGPGTVDLHANWTFTGSNQYVFIHNGSQFNIHSGGGFNG